MKNSKKDLGSMPIAQSRFLNPYIITSGDRGYESIIAIICTFRSPILNFSSTLKDSIKARKTQFEPLQNSVEFHMKYAMIQFDLCNYDRVKACFGLVRRVQIF